MASGMPVAMKNGRATPTRPGTVLQAAAVANISTTNLTPITTGLALSTSDTYTDAAVNTAVNTAVDTAVNALVTALETRLDAVDTKINALLAALRTSGALDT